MNGGVAKGGDERRESEWKNCGGGGEEGVGGEESCGGGALSRSEEAAIGEIHGVDKRSEGSSLHCCFLLLFDIPMGCLLFPTLLPLH